MQISKVICVLLKIYDEVSYVSDSMPRGCTVLQKLECIYVLSRELLLRNVIYEWDHNEMYSNCLNQDLFL